MGKGVCSLPFLRILYFSTFWNISTKIAAIKNIGVAHCQDCRGRNQIFLTENQSNFFIEILLYA